MSRNKPGVVVHISSIAGQVPFLPTPMYVASKHAISGFVRSLARLESPTPDIPRVRVSAVAPALIKTPLWTEHPEKMKFISEEDAGWVTPEFVAEAMLSLIEKEEYPGGTVLEVGKSVRKVTAFNDPGPASGGNSGKSVDQKLLESDIWASLEQQHGK
jgi:3-hydroxybutyrate dehydrogenase